MELPVYCTSIRPISGTANTFCETQVAVSCGGVIVDPGDWIFGDADGIIVGRQEELEPLLGLAGQIVAFEEDAVAQMHEGKSLIDLLTFREHLAALEAGDMNSKLGFRAAAKSEDESGATPTVEAG